MTWLLWRRYRLTVGAATIAVAMVALAMAWVVHEVDAVHVGPCPGGSGRCVVQPEHFFSLNAQVLVLNFVLAALPCVLGAVFGAPLVASELERRTNRLVWTQGISRTRWLLTKWVALLAALAALVVALTVEAQWWTGHVPQTPALVNVLGFWPGGRISPAYFPITGVAAVAYLIFAFALAAVAGGVLRKTGWAIFLSIVLYAGIATIMVLFVRPNLEPPVFVAWTVTQSGTGSDTSVQTTLASGTLTDSWYLGTAYRYAPGSNGQHRQSAAAVGHACEEELPAGDSYPSCLVRHDVQLGQLIQPAGRYWPLQWREASVLIVAAAVCLAGTVVAVRRWQS